MKNLLLFAVLVSLPLLLGGCGDNTVEEKQGGVQDAVHLEEPDAEIKTVEAISFSPHLKYEIEDDAVTITGCEEEASGNLIIPAIIKNKTVNKIGKEAFYGCASLTNISLPDSVTHIEAFAFGECKALTNIELPNGLTNIETGAFVESGLERVTIPDGVSVIGLGAFDGCSKITSIIIPDSVNTIAGSTFNRCSNMKNITIPESVTKIEPDAFGFCKILTAVTFLGDAPKVGNTIMFEASFTIYRKADAKGWGDTLAGRPVKLISEKP